MLKVADYLKLD